MQPLLVELYAVSDCNLNFMSMKVSYSPENKSEFFNIVGNVARNNVVTIKLKQYLCMEPLFRESVSRFSCL